MLGFTRDSYEINPYTGEKYKPCYCPKCGAECTRLFLDKYGEAFGCEHCVSDIDAWLYED